MGTAAAFRELCGFQGAAFTLLTLFSAFPGCNGEQTSTSYAFLKAGVEDSEYSASKLTLGISVKDRVILLWHSSTLLLDGSLELILLSSLYVDSLSLSTYLKVGSCCEATREHLSILCFILPGTVVSL